MFPSTVEVYICECMLSNPAGVNSSTPTETRESIITDCSVPIVSWGFIAARFRGRQTKGRKEEEAFGIWRMTRAIFKPHQGLSFEPSSSHLKALFHSVQNFPSFVFIGAISAVLPNPSRTLYKSPLLLPPPLHRYKVITGEGETHHHRLPNTWQHDRAPIRTRSSLVAPPDRAHQLRVVQLVYKIFSMIYVFLLFIITTRVQGDR